MRLLADSHVVFWWLLDAPQLSTKARSALSDPGNDILVSAVTLYELPLKQRAGKLPGDPEQLLPTLRRERFRLLPITAEHALRAALLPGPHRDPWDRLLMAQAPADRLVVVTADPVFEDYEVAVLW